METECPALSAPRQTEPKRKRQIWLTPRSVLVSVRSSLQCVDRKYHIYFEYWCYVVKHGKWSRHLLVFGPRARRGTITIRGTHNHAPLMKQQFVIQYITLMKQQFAINRKILQTEVNTTKQMAYRHSFRQNVVSAQNNCFFLYFLSPINDL